MTNRGAAARKPPLRWSLRLGSLFGIGLYLHVTFLVLLVWLAGARWVETHQIAAVAWTIGFWLALFTCVVLHELGHALTARHFGFETSEITLLPIGGVARMPRLPDAPRQSLLVALAGPAVNLAIATVLFLVLQLSGTGHTFDWTDITNAPMIDELLFLNVTLAVFNLLPAYPMDGGRALQALLALKMDYASATRIAARLGQMMALWFAIIGVMANPLFLLIALFVWIGGTGEAAMVEIRTALKSMTAGELATTEYHTVSADDRVEDLAGLVVHSGEPAFAVARDGTVIGLLTRADVLQAIKHAPSARLGDVLQRHAPAVVVESKSSADEVFLTLAEGARRAALVVDAGRVVGLLTMESVAAFQAFHDALGDRARSLLRGAPAA